MLVTLLNLQLQVTNWTFSRMSINLSTLVNQTNPVQICKAWVNFNGTLSGSITPRSSYNVSSITKNGTGDYTINFATPMADANYSVTATANTNSTFIVAQTYSQATSSVRIQTGAGNASYYNLFTITDASIISTAIFGN